MAKLLFKKGLYKDFKANVLTGNKAVEGALYVTEDEGGLYIGKSGGTVQRIQGTVLFFNTLAEFTNKVEPPYSTDVIYFIAENNALVRWTGEQTKWKQLNATAAEVTAELNSLQTQIDSVKNTADGAVQRTGDTMTGNLAMSGKKITGLGTPTDAADAATKKYVDDKDAALLGASTDAAGAATIHGALNAAKAAKDRADKGVSDASAAATAASNAQTKADSAYNLADGKATLAEVKALNYATKTEAQGYANAVLGDTDDVLSDKTVYGAIALGTKARQEASAAQTAADNAVKKAGDTMTGTLDMGSNAIISSFVPTADNHVTNKKYVDAAKSAALGAAAAVQDNLDDLNDAVNGEGGIASRLTQAESTITSHGTQLQAIDTKNANQDTAIQAAQKKANDAYALADSANTNAGNRVLKKDFEDFKTGYNTTISGINSDIDAVERVADAALPAAGGTVTGNITLTNNATITGVPAPSANSDVANKKYVDDAEQAAKDYADAQIAANDAMTFKGVVKNSNDLPLTAGSANVGDTYKVGASANYKTKSDGTVQAAKIGDLFINNADKDSDVPNWVHISSGYEDDYLQRILAENGKIFITDGVNENYASSSLATQKLGTISVVGDTASSATVATTMDANNNITVTVSLEWGSFN